MTKKVTTEMIVEEGTPRSNGNHDTNSSNHTGEQKHKQHIQHPKQHHQQPELNNYDVGLLYDPITPEARKSTKMVISIRDQKSGFPVIEYELVHDKLMHLIIVGEDLSYFAHIHPTLEDNAESFTIPHTFPQSGRYKLWIDFKPKGGDRTLIVFEREVIGNPIHKLTTLVYDGKHTKRSAEGKYQISLKLPEKIMANRDMEIVFSISDAANKPVGDLEPLMGAGGHSVIISRDTKEFLHVHPTEEVDPNWRGGPEISFRTNFPKSGIYKVWGQFQHQGKMIIADFVLEVI
jgi:hypothetical protein